MSIKIKTRAMFDAETADGCQNPACTHVDHDAGRIHHRLTMATMCHMGTSMAICRHPDTGLCMVICGDCGKITMALRPSEFSQDTMIWEDMRQAGQECHPALPYLMADPPCHHGGAIRVSYLHGSGLIQLHCAVCDDLLTTWRIE